MDANHILRTQFLILYPIWDWTLTPFILNIMLLTDSWHKSNSSHSPACILLKSLIYLFILFLLSLYFLSTKCYNLLFQIPLILCRLSCKMFMSICNIWNLLLIFWFLDVLHNILFRNVLPYVLHVIIILYEAWSTTTTTLKFYLYCKLLGTALWILFFYSSLLRTSLL